MGTMQQFLRMAKPDQVKLLRWKVTNTSSLNDSTTPTTEQAKLSRQTTSTMEFQSEPFVKRLLKLKKPRNQNTFQFHAVSYKFTTKKCLIFSTLPKSKKVQTQANRMKDSKSDGRRMTSFLLKTCSYLSAMMRSTACSTTTRELKTKLLPVII